MFHVRKTNGALRPASPGSRALAAPKPGLSAVVAMLFYMGAALGAAAFIYLRLSAAFGDPPMAGLLTTMIAITLLPFLGLGEDRAS